MAEYKAIRGHTIRTVAGDPDPLVTGDIWYSSTTRKIRGAKIAAGSWASGGDMNQIRMRNKSAGTATACLTVGGRTGPGSGPDIGGGGVYHDECETYDGSAWTEGTDLNTSGEDRFTSSAGTSTSCIAACAAGLGPGAAPVTRRTITESWNGTSWTEVGLSLIHI